MSDGDRDDGGFLARWSRRKRASVDEPPVGRDESASRGPKAPAGTDLTDEEQQRVVEQLPDIESLDANADFSAFLQEGVPAELRERALRKLWRLDPVFANLDGLNDYDLDYTDAATVVENLKSAWRAGKGYVREEGTAGAGEAPPDRDTAEVTGKPAADSAASAPAEVAESGSAAEEGEGTGPRVPDSPTPDDGPASTPPSPSPSTSQRSRKPAGSAVRRRWG